MTLHLLTGLIPQNGLEILLRGAMSMFFSVIGDNSITIYTHKDDRDAEIFSIKLDIGEVSDDYIFGITFDYHDAIEIPIGNLVLTLDFIDRRNSEGESWVPSDLKVYDEGITFQFLKWSTSGSPMFDTHFSLEFGHLSVHLGKSDKKPMLDGFAMLDAVAITTSFGLHILGGLATAGGRLDIEGFGISLGGDGESDGGNSMASGVLAGDNDGGEAVNPTFDLSVWKYDVEPLGIDMQGKAECWFPINKQFGPIKIAQIGVRIDAEQTYDHQDGHGPQVEPRLAILIDGEAEIAGFLAQVDDLEVSFPLLRLTDFKGDDSNGWQYDMAGCAISYKEGGLEVAGALRKVVVTDTSGNSYIEYQGLCTLKAKDFGLSAIGAFGKVPTTGDDSYVTCFVIAAVDATIGGTPEFFITGVAGGLGLNRSLILPDVTHVPSSPFMLALEGFGGNPMGALESIRSALPAERGTLWFAAGLKFTTYQVVESRAVSLSR